MIVRWSVMHVKTHQVVAASPLGRERLRIAQVVKETALPVSFESSFPLSCPFPKSACHYRCRWWTVLMISVLGTFAVHFIERLPRIRFEVAMLIVLYHSPLVSDPLDEPSISTFSGLFADAIRETLRSALRGCRVVNRGAPRSIRLWHTGTSCVATFWADVEAAACPPLRAISPAHRLESHHILVAGSFLLWTDELSKERRPSDHSVWATGLLVSSMGLSQPLVIGIFTTIYGRYCSNQRPARLAWTFLPVKDRS